MALQLVFSNDFSVLVREMWAEVDRQWTSPLDPPALLVPNRVVDKWIKLRISEQSGVVLGITGRFMESFLWELLTRRQSDSSPPPQLIHGELLQGCILHIMRPKGPVYDEETLAPLRHYVSAEGDKGGAARRFHLAAHLANLFLEYEYSRPDLFDSSGEKRFSGILGAWPTRDYFSPLNGRAKTTEQWQRRVYELVFGEDGPLMSLEKATGSTYTTLPRLVRGIAPQEVAQLARAQGLNSPLFVFGLSGLSLFHRQMLISLSLAVDVHVYTLNPCSAFWEDVKTVPFRVARGRVKEAHIGKLSLQENDWERFCTDTWDTKSLLESELENPLLARWGHSGKENIALWCQAAEYNFSDVYSPSNPTTLLGKLKHTLLYRLDKLDDIMRSDQDSTLQVFDAPGTRREVETMRDCILDLLRNDTTLSPTDIAVYVTDPTQYRAVLYEVMDAYPADHPFHIPWSLVDESSGQTHFSDAISAVLQIQESGFSRNAVFSFLRNPLIRTSCGIGEDTIAVWEQWALRLGISHGYDDSHRKQLGEHLPTIQHTWCRAFERLILGHIGEGDTVLDESPDHSDRVIRPFVNMQSLEQNECALFIQTVESLYRDVCALERAQSWSEAANTLERFIDSWFRVPPELPNEERAQTTYLDKIRQLTTRDSFSGAIFDLDEFLWCVRGFADFDLPQRGSALTGKLTISAIGHCRAIPYRVIYIIGMQEGSFPGSAHPDSLDLRTCKYIPGDQRPLWQKQYAFLEVITCAQEMLVLSFTGRNPARDEPLQPCSTLSELLSFVESALLSGSSSFRIQRIPLLAERESDIAPEGVHLPPSYDEEAASVESASLMRSLPPGGAAMQAIDLSGTGEKHLEIATYTIDELFGFLLNPAEFTLKKGLRLRDSQHGLPVEDAEPISSDALARWNILDEFCKRVISFRSRGDQRSIEDLLTSCYTDWCIDGKAPEGFLATLDFESLRPHGLALGTALDEELSSLEGSTLQPTYYLSAHTGTRLRPYVEIIGTGKSIRISGGPYCLKVGKDGETAILCPVATPCLKIRKGEVQLTSHRYLIKSLLAALSLVAAGNPTPEIRLLSCTSDRQPAAMSIRLDVKCQNAKEYLSSLIDDMDNPERQLDYLPFRAVEETWRRCSNEGDYYRALLEWIEEDADDPRGLSIRQMEALKATTPQLPAHCGDIVRNRFSLLFGAGREV